MTTMFAPDALQHGSIAIGGIRARTSPILSVVVPTFNERGNMAELVRRLEAALPDIAWELVVVDDNSPDGTAAFVKSLAANDARVRCIRRVGRRGLAGACIEGMLASAAPFVAVMDGDLQHDERILPKMLARLTTDAADIVVGSRHVDGGSADEGFTPARAAISRFATGLTAMAFKTDVRDLMSGFFMLRRDIVEDLAPQLTTSGFKILADILASKGPQMRTEEIAYEFRKREVGASKLSLKVALDFAGLLINKVTRGVLPVSFVFFALVGLAGVAVHLTVLRVAMGAGLDFGHAQVMATVVAMTSNFFVNNVLTYNDKRLRGMAAMRGLMLFYCVCSVGAVANIGTAMFLYGLYPSWLLPALAGVVMGAVWNYTLSSVFVWRPKV